ncbi:hypothetical protein Pan258_46230 [Symmachiella dynata]|uniref:caspase family protein n=1 Tax=Symmachiella dynata TaxID=2527995 RepID=UPI0011878B60|nr:caspase family protein [Symmachiella dynata]QDT50544.1 hypothetical protein Pan258_46230 [Symmachiella dynata]
MADNQLHVLLLGVSEYPNLPGPGDLMIDSAYGLQKLTSPAISAFRVYQWLLKANEDGLLPLPLSDELQLLLSPSQAELDACPEMVDAQNAGKFKPCTLDNVLIAADKWRKAASNQQGDMTWFHFSGHGVQRSNTDAVLLLEEFGLEGGGRLVKSIDVNTLTKGMAPSPSRPDIARTQAYFIDACRMRPEEFNRLDGQEPTQLFTVELNLPDDRSTPILFASISGDEALGFNARESLFVKSLLHCLNGNAGILVDNDQGESQWVVTIQCLPEVLKYRFAQEGFNQTVILDGPMNRDIHLKRSTEPPHVDVLIDVNPDTARASARIDVIESTRLSAMPLPSTALPISVRWPAGYYRFQVTVTPPYMSLAPMPRLLLPPRRSLIGKVV